MSVLVVDEVLTAAEDAFARAGHARPVSEATTRQAAVVATRRPQPAVGPAVDSAVGSTVGSAVGSAVGSVVGDRVDAAPPACAGANTPPARMSGPRARVVRAAEPAGAVRATGPHHALAPTVAERIDVLRAQDRSPVLDAADEDRGAVPPTDPTVLAGRIALATVEVLGGRRPLAQLARWLTPGVYDALQVRTDLTLRVRRGRRTSRAPQVRRVRTCTVDQHTLEASAVVEDGPVVRAVAVRLEAHRGAWRATVLEIG